MLTGRTNGQADMTKRKVAFSNFASAREERQGRQCNTVARSSNVYTSLAILQPNDNLVEGGRLYGDLMLGGKSLHEK